MKDSPFPLKKIFLIIILFCVSELRAQHAQRDTIHYVKSATPYRDSIDVRSVTHSQYTTNDSITDRLNISFPVFSNFINHVPGLPLNFENLQIAGLRHTFTPLYVIDGMPYNSRFSTINRISNFEYEHVTVVPGIHGAAAFGGWGANGAYILESKSGRGFSEDLIEINSTTTKSYSEMRIRESFFVDDRIAINYLTQTTNVSWQRDFGKIDSRIGVNHQVSHGDVNLEWFAREKEKWYGISTTTGLDAKKLQMKFIGNINFRELNSSEDETWADDALYSGQLILEYALMNNFQLQSNTLLQKRNWQNKDFESQWKSWEKRAVTNLFANYKYSAKGIALNSLGGFQIERWKDEPISFPWYKEGDDWNIKTTSVLIGAEALINGWFAVQMQTRRDVLDKEGKSSSSLGAAFNFTNASQAALLNLKFRINYASGEINKAYFPLGRQVDLPLPSQNYYDPFVGGKKRALEMGLDISSPRSEKISGVINVYHDKLEKEQQLFFPASTRGIEVVTTFRSRFGNLRTSNKILAGLSKLKYAIMDSVEQIRSTNLSLVNQSSWRRLSGSIMLDFRNLLDQVANSAILNGNYLWIRNLGVMYTLSSASKNTDIRIGLVGRNLLVAKPKDSFNPENSTFATKSLSLNLTFTFR